MSTPLPAMATLRRLRLSRLHGRAGLCAVAITDHDTLAGVREAQQSAGDLFEIITGVEISANYAGREVHLLGNFIRLDHSELNARLEQVCDSRRERFSNYIDRLARGGNPIPADRVRLVEAGSASLGRRHVAKLLVACKIAGTQTEAFHRYLGPLGKVVLPKRLIPVQEAIQLVIGAGGVASLAHPSPELADEDFRTLKAFGLDALEAEYPWSTGAPTRHLREIASRFSFAISGGSDCHGGIATAQENRFVRDPCGATRSPACVVPIVRRERANPGRQGKTIAPVTPRVDKEAT